jgi:hypothetical protein
VPDRLSSLLFIVALVICQFSLVLHQLDYDQHAGDHTCTICVASQFLDHALNTEFLHPTVEAVVESPGFLPVYFPLSRAPARLVARSPPATPLQA